MQINHRSVRFRVTVGAALALGALVIISGIGIDWLVGREVRRSADASLLEQASDRAQLLSTGAQPQALVTVTGYEEFAAVISPSGDVLAFSGTTTPAALAAIGPGVQEIELALIEDEGEDSEPHLETVRLAGVEASDGSMVIVGSEGEETRRTTNVVRTILLVGGPIMAVVGALISWFVAGRALAPVYRLRADLDGVVKLSDHRRVEAPGTEDEIDDLASTMNDLLGRLEQQSAARRQFVADASHELKSPLANARALLETVDAPAGSERLGPTERETNVRVVGELDRLQSLVDDLLYLARTDETAVGERVVFDLDDVVFDEAERAAIRTSFTIDASGVQPARIVGDRSEVARAVRNLVENAVRHASSRVSLAVEPAAGEWVVVVADDGEGIPPEDRERIFDRFARLATDRSRGDGGTGLGLSIVASVAARNGGSVSVVDHQGAGARLELRLPRAE